MGEIAGLGFAVSRRDVDVEAIMGRVVRDMGQADDVQLDGIEDVVTKLLNDYERFMGGDLVTYLCAWREAAQRHKARRRAETDAKKAGVTPLPSSPRRRERGRPEDVEPHVTEEAR